jgi:hypothetical protein
MSLGLQFDILNCHNAFVLRMKQSEKKRSHLGRSGRVCIYIYIYIYRYECCGRQKEYVHSGQWGGSDIPNNTV